MAPEDLVDPRKHFNVSLSYDGQDRSVSLFDHEARKIVATGYGPLPENAIEDLKIELGKLGWSDEEIRIALARPPR